MASEEPFLRHTFLSEVPVWDIRRPAVQHIISQTILS
jgi:hypothetical protein